MGQLYIFVENRGGGIRLLLYHLLFSGLIRLQIHTSLFWSVLILSNPYSYSTGWRLPSSLSPLSTTTRVSMRRPSALTPQGVGGRRGQQARGTGSRLQETASGDGLLPSSPLPTHPPSPLLTPRQAPQH